MVSIEFKGRDVDNSAERLICTGIIVSDTVIEQLAPILTDKLMTARYTKYIVRWCLDFFMQYGKAPGGHIQDIFEAAKREYLEEDSAELIEALLSSLNDEAVGHMLNEAYILEQAEQYIKSRQALVLCEDVAALLSKGRITEAEGLIASYSIPKRLSAECVDVFDASFWKEEEKESEVLFRLPGALHDLIGPIERDSFISLLASEKVGKTWRLLHFALTAYRQRRNVVFFSCGDMTLPQMRRRIRHMLTGRDPKRAKETFLYPILDCLHNQSGKCPIGEETSPIVVQTDKRGKALGTLEEFPDHVVCTKCFGDKYDDRHFIGTSWLVEKKLKDVEKPLDEACKAIIKRSGNSRFKLFCYPPSTLTVAQISAQLDILLQQENYMPDVVIVDYADLLDVEPSARKFEYRHQINATWMALRALAQVRKCAVITATQAKLAARKKSQVDQTDTSEDKRKLAHVTAMLALSQSPEEKCQGIMRISNIAMRDADFDVNRSVAVLQCLAIGKPYLVSYEHKNKQDKKGKDNE